MNMPIIMNAIKTSAASFEHQPQACRETHARGGLAVAAGEVLAERRADDAQQQGHAGEADLNPIVINSYSDRRRAMAGEISRLERSSPPGMPKQNKRFAH